jgi:hypothetical protein
MIGKPSISARKVCFLHPRGNRNLIALSCSDYLYIKLRATSIAILRNTPKTNRRHDLANNCGHRTEISAATTRVVTRYPQRDALKSLSTFAKQKHTKRTNWKSGTQVYNGYMVYTENLKEF